MLFKEVDSVDFFSEFNGFCTSPNATLFLLALAWQRGN